MFRPFGTPSTSVTTGSTFGTPAGSQQTGSGFGFGTPSGGLFSAGSGSSSAFGAQSSMGFGAMPSYTPTTDMENNITITLQAITAMPAYGNRSLEELRLEDYGRGRKGAAVMPFGGGATSAATPMGASTFGQPTSAPQASLAPSAFGAMQSATPLFGAPSTSTGTTGAFGFGGGSGSGIGGAPGTLLGLGATGQQPQQQQSLLGVTANTPFGSATPSQTTTGGIFGTPAGGAFSAFGKPAGTTTLGTTGFTQPGTLAFGGGAATGTGGSLFGGGVGVTGTTNVTGAPGTGLFSNTLAAPTITTSSLAQQPSPFAKPGGLFGTTPTQPQLGGLLAQPQPQGQMPLQQQAQQQQSSFGQLAPATGSGGFTFGGATQGATQPATNQFSFGATQPAAINIGGGGGGSLFGNSTGIGFGIGTQPVAGTTATAAPTQSFSFTGLPTTTTTQAPIMGTPAGAPSSLFTFPQSTPATAPAGGGFSFNLPSLSTTANTPGLSVPPMGSLMGGGVSTSGGNLPIIAANALSIKPPIPAGLAIGTRTEAIGTTSVGGGASLGLGLATPISSIQRTASNTASNAKAETSTSPKHFTPRSSFRLQPPSETPIIASRRPNVPTMATGFVMPRRISAKKLVVAPLDAKNQQESTSMAAPTITTGSLSATPIPLSRLGSFSEIRSLDAHHQQQHAEGTITESGGIPQAEGTPYMLPSEAALRKLPYSQLSALTNFTVGRRGVGEVRFLQPVDLTKIDIASILERIVIFEPKQVTVYPDDDFDEQNKPPVGSGLNVAAEVHLQKCWPVSKATRTPITDMSNERLRRHVERLKTVEGTTFVDYLPETGTWIFAVEHFSRYGFVDEPEDEVAMGVEMERNALEQENEGESQHQPNGTAQSIPILQEWPAMNTRRLERGNFLPLAIPSSARFSARLEDEEEVRRGLFHK